MISKMSKYAFLVHNVEYKDFLNTIRKNGVVHISEKNLNSDNDVLKVLSSKMDYANGIYKELSMIFASDENQDNSDTSKIDFSEESFEKYIKEAKVKIENLNLLDNEIDSKIVDKDYAAIWGNFEQNSIEELANSGYLLDFISISSKDFQTLDRKDIIAIKEEKSLVYAVWIHKEGDFLDKETEAIVSIVEKPKNSFSILENEYLSLLNKKDSILQELKAMYLNIKNRIDTYFIEVENKYNFSKAELSGEILLDNRIVYLEGWVPTSQIKGLENDLSAKSYFFKELEITSEDKIPIKLKNNSFTKLFEPITEMFSLPNYGEIDQTALFAPFFMLFFGLCFGDGGYGLLLFAIATIFIIMKKGSKSVLRLLQYLGASAAVIGLLMGSFFGVTLEYAKGESYFLNQNNLMLLSIVLGLVQIIFAKIVAAYKTKIQRGLKYSLAQFAWIIFIVIAIAYFVTTKYMPVIPDYLKYTLYGVSVISLLIAFLYNNPDKNPFINIGSGVWNAYNMASGLLGDTLSYIRLFAIGLTGGILGSVFNSLAIEQTAGLNPILRIPLAIIVLLIGHGLNIGLAMISSFVHPLRLTFVEYYKNSEFEGGGTKYKPFTEKNKK